MGNIKNKKVLVVGLGISGLAVIKELSKKGAVLSVHDDKERDEIAPAVIELIERLEIENYLGSRPTFDGVDLVVLSPGISPTGELIREAVARGIEVIGEIELAYRIGRGKYVAITGTNGKTTTTAWIGAMFKRSGANSRVVGNIGLPLISEAIKQGEDKWLITEVSSYQLETVELFKPDISVLLNITPDHMDRHKTMENYGEAKARIFGNQTGDDFLVVNFDDKLCLNLSTYMRGKIFYFSIEEKLKYGAFLNKGKIVIREHEGSMIEYCSIDELKIPGTHNVENALAAVSVCYLAGIDRDVIREELISFKGVEHRIEFFAQAGGIRYLNDSKGTNVDAAIRAIEAVKEDIVLIGGGFDKGADFDPLIKAAIGKVKGAVFMGATAAKLKEASERLGLSNTIVLENMDECVREATRMAVAGDVVLLSPACASWDMYKNFEERGDHFKNCVEGMMKDGKI